MLCRLPACAESRCILRQPQAGAGLERARVTGKLTLDGKMRVYPSEVFKKRNINRMPGHCQTRYEPNLGAAPPSAPSALRSRDKTATTDCTARGAGRSGVFKNQRTGRKSGSAAINVNTPSAVITETPLSSTTTCPSTSHKRRQSRNRSRCSANVKGVGFKVAGRRTFRRRPCGAAICRRSGCL